MSERIRMINVRIVAQAIGNTLVAFAAVAGAVAAFKFLLMPAFESLLGPAATATVFVRRAGIALAAIGGYWACARWYERRRAEELAISPLRLFLGAVSGPLLISFVTLSLFALGAYEATEYRSVQSALAGVAGVILVAAVLEEIVFRGILFRLFEPAIGTTAAIVLTSLVFGAVHLPNLRGDVAASELLTTFLSVTLISAFWTVLFARMRNLGFITLHHAAWNFSIVLSGASLSGVDEWRAAAPFTIVDHGPVWLTGGSFGPEDSIITIALVAAIFIAWWRFDRSHKVPTDTCSAPSPVVESRVVALSRAAGSLTELWSPRVVAEVDDCYVKVAKVRGEFGWHSHAEDELFVSLRGSLCIRMETSDVVLCAGDCYVVRKGVRHNPLAAEECLLMLFERKSTLHAGADGNEKARSLAEQLRPLAT